MGVFVEQEYARIIVTKLLEMIRPQLSRVTIQAFELQVIHEYSASKTAKKLNLTLDQVYAAKSRVFKRLREYGEGLLD